MDFKLKKVKYQDTLSEETPCFSAELWVDGKLLAYVSNRGVGGCNDITPAKGYDWNDVAPYSTIDVECDIFGAVYDDVDRKRLQGKGIVLKKDNKIYTVNFPMGISKLKKHPQGMKWINDHKQKFVMEGYKILNTNL